MTSSSDESHVVIYLLADNLDDTQIFKVPSNIFPSELLDDSKWITFKQKNQRDSEIRKLVMKDKLATYYGNPSDNCHLQLKGIIHLFHVYLNDDHNVDKWREDMNE